MTIGGGSEGFGGPYKLGMTQADAGVPRVYVDDVFFRFDPEPKPAHYDFESQQPVVPYTQRYEYGHFIGRPTNAIPEPSTTALAALRMLALFALRATALKVLFCSVSATFRHLAGAKASNEPTS